MYWSSRARLAALALVATLIGLAMAACDTRPPPGPLPEGAAATSTPLATAPTTATPGQSTAQPAARATSQLYLPEVSHGQALRTPRPPEVALAPPTPAPPAPGAPTATRTPGPTRTPRPTPTPKFPPPIAEPGPSKLGLHVINNNSHDIMEFVRVTKPRLLKAVDDLHWLQEAKQASPQTVTIGRITTNDQRMEGDPAARARAFVAEQAPKYNAYRDGVDYWEGWNEPAPKTREEMAWYAAFEAERVRALAEMGLKAAVGTYPTGVPEWELMEVFLPAIQAAKQHGGVLALHEYSAPTMQFGVGAGLPGRPSVPNRGTLNLRYRYWYEDFLKPRGLTIPLVITEAGIDGGITNRPGPPEARGWRDFGGYWESQGLGGDSLRAYLDQLAWYDQETRQDPYVLGFTVFTAGNPPGDQWESFDVTDVLPAIARYLVAQ